MNNLLTGSLTYDLMIAIALFVLFAWCVRRGLLHAKEVLWIGLALSFFTSSLVFQGALYKTKPFYEGDTRRLLGMTALSVVPLVLAMIYGVFVLYRTLVGKEWAVLQRGGLTLRLVVGNIAALKYEEPLDAIVNPANTELRMTTGVAGALKTYGGAGIEREARAKAPLRIGQAITTRAGRLPAAHVIHAVALGPDLKTDPDKIKKALDGALRCAGKIGARRLALPAFPGVGKIDAAMVAPLMVEAILHAGNETREVFLIVPHRRLARPFQAEFIQREE